MYSDIALQLAIKFNQLSAETQIVIMQTILIITEICAFLYIRHITKEWYNTRVNRNKPWGVYKNLLGRKIKRGAKPL